MARHRLPASATLVMLAVLAAPALSPNAAAQSAAYFSPTYAASQGSPYSSVYARAFGAGGPPPAAPAEAPSPLVTGAGPAQAEPESGDVVYVIENGRLLTYRAADYARGQGPALAGTAVPPALGTPPDAELSSITSRLYGNQPLATGAGPTIPADPGAPIPLVPPQQP